MYATRPFASLWPLIAWVIMASGASHFCQSYLCSMIAQQVGAASRFIPPCFATHLPPYWRP
ncbi:hypothetical protein HYPSUDRAFT_66798 [Hypholoma sublateritium FD-334 SS-4]|uniref:Major facilitator superfamily (MFS) profile domain-containing protein n=1 Tax=Hypholoma sublateritium (strain FD-334 SS-4) TaxID=945553 RepID=A0A0D2NVH8_HYPSF|nr:hypothetical protein HYPSUDRAFT_66798 [Hypholoma sublateritium FD-334 SS-4]